MNYTFVPAYLLGSIHPSIKGRYLLPIKNNMRILVIEDEPKVAMFIKKGLEEQIYNVDLAYEGAMGKKLLLQNNYDAVILDIILPKMDGIEVCREIRKHYPAIPILILTTLSSADDEVAGLDAGANDYLTKPFKFKELHARLCVLLKKNNKLTGNTLLSIGDLKLDTGTKVVKRKNTIIKLTVREYCLLEFLMKNANRVLSRSEISENVWDASYDQDSNFVDVYINYLRKKIDKNFSGKLIHTVFGMGYIFREEAAK
jgi:two-component system copper resistance phosphate regulon response regulator CusR